MEAVQKKSVLLRIAFPVAAGLFITIALLYLYNIVQWRNYPDFGFTFRTATGVRVVGVVSHNGYKAGLRVGDKIIKVNGESFDNIQEFRTAMNRNLGGGNEYLIERAEGESLITIVNAPLGLTKSFVRSGFLFILGMSYIMIGILVFMMKPHSKVGWVFFIVVATFGLFVTFLDRTGTLTPNWLETVHVFIYTFAPATFIHLAFHFPQERRVLKRNPSVQIVPYTVSALLFLCIRSVAREMTDVPPLWMIILVTYMSVGIMGFMGSCFQLWRTSPSAIARTRSKMILLGAAVATSVPLVDFVSSAVFHFYILPGFNYYLPFFIVFPAFVGYSIVKHDLFDIEAVIKRTYGYILTTASIAVAYAIFTTLSNVAFANLAIAKFPIFPLIFVLAVVFLFNPVRNRAQRFIDRVFYRLEYDYQETVQRISETMRSLLKLDEIVKSIMDTALGVMFIESGSLFLLNRARLAYECVGFGGEIAEGHESREASVAAEGAGGREPGLRESADARSELRLGEGLGDSKERGKAQGLPELMLLSDHPFIENLAEAKKEVTIYDIQEDPLYRPNRETCEEAFERLGAILIVPLIYEERLIGLISLGEKKSGKFYRREDINLLKTLANQGAVAIENALLLEEMIEKERMQEELAIAHDLQMSMLPAKCPEIEGFEIAAVSMPAREVGGDFYDFIEIEEGQVGLVIGDVTGKSVSGALVMSASRSVFRMLSEQELTVGQIMTRANERTKKDVKSGMFVALLFAVIDGRNRALSLSSAGQTQPICFRAETGEAGLIETKGDKAPLGIFEDSEYQETRLQLAPGDKIVFYTDGIVEATNEQGEMFGFDRLIEAIQGTRSLTAEALLKEITDRINAFAGGAPQHDDLTVIVLNATE